MQRPATSPMPSATHLSCFALLALFQCHARLCFLCCLDLSAEFLVTSSLVSRHRGQVAVAISRRKDTIFFLPTSTRKSHSRGSPSLGHIGCSPDCKDQVCRSRLAIATQRLSVASP